MGQSMRREATEELESAVCTDCLSPDPHQRYAHHSMLMREGGVALLRLHLYRYFAQTPRISTDERREAIEDVCVWLGGLAQQYSGFADATTGAPLPWWEARRQRMEAQGSTARSAYEQAPMPYKQQYPYGGSTTPRVPGFSKVQRPISGIAVTLAQQQREPSDDDYLREPDGYTEEPGFMTDYLASTEGERDDV